jgi:CPA2 family monovalent cation:H+ antiporter-2
LLGANEVIPEELETSIEIFSRTLARYLIPKDEVDALVHAIREDSYAILRREDGGGSMDFRREQVKTLFPGVAFEVLKVEEGSRLAGRSIAGAKLRGETGLTILAVRRERSVLSSPSPDFVLEAGDVVVVAGSAEQLARGAAWFKP